jgi:hypothetical protein
MVPFFTTIVAGSMAGSLAHAASAASAAAMPAIRHVVASVTRSSRRASRHAIPRNSGRLPHRLSTGTIHVMPPFAASLRARLALPLPGLDAQLRMAPRPRPGWDPHAVPPGMRDAAGLLLLYPHDGDWQLLLTLRASALRHHTGQVSLPGGRVDPGETLEQAALREAFEEVGIGPGGIEIVDA